ncbi:MAG: hypothetical protein HZA80_01425 [Candidatus Taylorbacteria bacterium]|nr:hypothetical protein [Candidatus Taylorbacteria bacterium]
MKKIIMTTHSRTISYMTGLGISLMVAFGVVAIPQYVHAVTLAPVAVTEQNDFVLEPGKVEVFLNPGESVTRSISITNRIKRKVHFKIEVEDFVGSRDIDKPVVLLGNDKSPYSFKDNLVPEVREFTLEFGQRINIPISINVPQDAQPGGFYSSVLISNEPDKDEQSAQNSQTVAQNKIISRLGVLFFVRVNGDANESGSVEEFRVQPSTSFIRQQGPTTFEILYNNSGSIHLVPFGTVDITNTFGRKVTTLPVDAYFSLPNSLRYRSVEWDKVYLIGRYKATLHLNRGYGNIVDERVVTFWVIPWKILAALFGVIVFVVGLGYYIASRFEFKRKV